MCNTTVVIISVAKIVSRFHGIGLKVKKGVSLSFLDLALQST